MQERETARLADHLGSPKSVRGEGPEILTERRRAVDENFFRDLVGREKGAQPQQIGGGTAGAFDFFKSERERGADRIVFRLADSAQFGACLSVKLQILDRGGGCLLYKMRLLGQAPVAGHPA